MSTLPGPYEILELGDGEMRLLRVEGFESGEVSITPRDGRGPKVITAIRIQVPREDKPLFPHYWDLTASTLVAQVLPILQREQRRPLDLRLTKYGVAPRARFTVEVLGGA